ncbi:hypothetical protein AS593_07575 [Caulobacter vibrioides]|nr:hypothetical protein AS593_07575 [Caulobacter vibrioides]
MQQADGLCPDDQLSDAMAALGTDPEGAILRTQALAADFPNDARVQFLHGSLLAGSQRYAEADGFMQKAVDLEPNYHIARYQLGFLKFTSGDVVGAATAWEPLGALSADDPLRLFVVGHIHLAQDQFQDALAAFRQGVRRNELYPPVNGDIELLIARIEETLASGAASEATPVDESEEMSAAHWLLKRHDDGQTRH